MGFFLNQTFKIKMKNESKKVQDMITYFVLCCHLRDFIEENVEQSKFNYRKIKMLTNQLSVEIEKSINIVFKADGFSKEDKDAMLDNYTDAVQTMEKFFRTGLAMQHLSEQDVENFSQEVTLIAKRYGIDH